LISSQPRNSHQLDHEIPSRRSGSLLVSCVLAYDAPGPEQDELTWTNYSMYRIAQRQAYLPL